MIKTSHLSLNQMECKERWDVLILSISAGVGMNRLELNVRIALVDTVGMECSKFRDETHFLTFATIIVTRPTCYSVLCY